MKKRMIKRTNLVWWMRSRLLRKGIKAAAARLKDIGSAHFSGRIKNKKQYGTTDRVDYKNAMVNAEFFLSRSLSAYEKYWPANDNERWDPEVKTHLNLARVSYGLNKVEQSLVHAGKAYQFSRCS